MSPGALVLTHPLFVARIPTGAVVPEDPLTLARTLSSSRTAASCDLACLYLHCPATMYTSNRVKKPHNLHSPNTTEAPPTTNRPLALFPREESIVLQSLSRGHLLSRSAVYETSTSSAPSPRAAHTRGQLSKSSSCRDDRTVKHM